MQERGEGSQRGRDKGHLEQARIKTYIELLRESIKGAKGSFLQVGPGQTGSKVKLKSWAHPLTGQST